jgi:hypothetical protein
MVKLCSLAFDDVNDNVIRSPKVSFEKSVAKVFSLDFKEKLWRHSRPSTYACSSMPISRGSINCVMPLV